MAGFKGPGKADHRGSCQIKVLELKNMEAENEKERLEIEKQKIELNREKISKEKLEIQAKIDETGKVASK